MIVFLYVFVIGFVQCTCLSKNIQASVYSRFLFETIAVENAVVSDMFVLFVGKPKEKVGKPKANLEKPRCTGSFVVFFQRKRTARLVPGLGLCPETMEVGETFHRSSSGNPVQRIFC